jgi:hypothetical protein
VPKARYWFEFDSGYDKLRAVKYSGECKDICVESLVVGMQVVI